MTRATLPPFTGGRLVLATMVLSLATFMQVLDTTITNVAIPTVAGNLGSSVSEGTWIITSFGVANAISVLLSGWMARRFGQVRVLLVATVGFAVTSLCSGLSPTLEVLILFRVLQGALAGPLIPLAQSLLISVFPRSRQAMALALWSMTVILAPVVGPILGGWITDNWIWRGIFFINVPVGIVVAVVVAWMFRDRESVCVRDPVDRVGLALLVLGVSALQIALDLGNRKDWFSSAEIVALVVVAAISLVLLLVWERDEAHPVVELELFRSRNFSIGVLLTAMGFMLMFGSMMLLPMLMQETLGYTATLAGLALSGMGVFPIFLAPVIGRNASRIDLRWVVSLGFLVFAACFWWRSFYTPQVSFGWFAWPQFIQGIGLACFLMPLTVISLSGLDPERIPAAASVYNFLRTLSGAIGVSLTTTLWDNRASLHHETLGSHVNVFNPLAREAFDALSARGASETQAGGVINEVLTRLAFFDSAADIFWLFALLYLALIPLVWLARPPFSSPAAGAAQGG